MGNAIGVAPDGGAHVALLAHKISHGAHAKQHLATLFLANRHLTT